MTKGDITQDTTQTISVNGFFCLFVFLLEVGGGGGGGFV